MTAALAGCLDLGDSISDVSADQCCSAQPEADTGPGGEGSRVVLANLAFDPVELTVSAGSTVTWINQDSAFHVISSGTPEDNEHDWTSPDILFGEEWSRTFDTPGEFVYYCDNHSRVMRDAIIYVE